jgi:hypothetical protein
MDFRVFHLYVDLELWCSVAWFEIKCLRYDTASDFGDRDL